MPIFDGGRIFKAKIDMEDLIVWTNVVIVDTREQSPFHFKEMTAVKETSKGRITRPFVVPTKRGTLKSGDYSVEGYETKVSVERKSHQDLVGTLGDGRVRFENELARLNEMEFAAVVCEAPWTAVMRGLPDRKLSPQSIYGSVVSFQQRFTRVHWWMCISRRDAETTTFRILKRFVEGGLRK